MARPHHRRRHIPHRAVAIHATTEVCDRHREMGFHERWGAALDQLVALLGDER